MNILLLGDIVGPAGRNIVINKLPEIINKKKIDFVIVNGENAGDNGVGITKKIPHPIQKITEGESSMGSQKIVRLIQKNYKRDKKGKILFDEYGQPVPDDDNWWTITEWNIGVERDAQSAVLSAKNMSKGRITKTEKQERLLLFCFCLDSIAKRVEGMMCSPPAPLCMENKQRQEQLLLFHFFLLKQQTTARTTLTFMLLFVSNTETIKNNYYFSAFVLIQSQKVARLQFYFFFIFIIGCM